MKKFFKKDAKDFFFACKYSTSMMNMFTVIIAALVVMVAIKEVFNYLLVILSPFLTVLTAVICVLLGTYCIGTILFSVIFYFSESK